MTVEMSKFAETVMFQKYSHTKKDENLETWENIAYRVSKNVMKAVGASNDLVEDIRGIILQRKFIPGGRYLYATGRPYHQVNNCFLFRAEDSREGWAELLQKSALALMTGGGIGIDYSQIRPEGKPIRKTGGFATGPLALAGMVNECGRGIMQGGSRRSAIWAGLNWLHQDINKFITLKNWIPEVREMKSKDFNFPANMDGTNISVQLDDDFFKAYHDEKHTHHSQAQSVYWTTVRQMLKTGEPGFSIDTGKNSRETLRNAPICSETQVLTRWGYKPVNEVSEIATCIWTGKRWAEDVIFHKTAEDAPVVTISMTGGREIRCELNHPFFVEKYKGVGEKRKLVSIVKIPASKLKPGDILHTSLPSPSFQHIGEPLNQSYYALGYVYGDGSFTNDGRSAEITFCTEESKKCAKELLASFVISSVNMEDSRGYARMYFKTDQYFWSGRSKEVFPTGLYGCSQWQAMCFLAGLFDADGNWEPQTKRIRLASKHEGFLRGVARLLEQYGILAGVSKAGHSTYGKAQTYQLVIMSEHMTNFSILVPCVRIKPDLAGYKPYRDSKIKVLSVEDAGFDDVYCADVKVPEHSFQAEGVIISNCTEVTSEDDSDVCNLGSINLARINSTQEMAEVVELATAFLLAGTIYSDVPFSKVDLVRGKNRRLGLGLMGLHEWLLTHGKQYGPDDDLAKYLEIYQRSGEFAKVWAKKWDLSTPVKTRAIAPVGTIGILGETSTGVEPLFCVAYKRRYLKGNIWNYQYVIDPTAKRLIDSGVDADSIEDAYTLAEDVERRVLFNVWMQIYVDHSISSTINLPAWGTELNNDSQVQKFGKMLIGYLPHLRGLTVYPDGSRNGQPLTAVKYSTAIKHTGEIFIENSDVCSITKGESCGS